MEDRSNWENESKRVVHMWKDDLSNHRLGICNEFSCFPWNYSSNRRILSPQVSWPKNSTIDGFDGPRDYCATWQTILSMESRLPRIYVYAGSISKPSSGTAMHETVLPIQRDE